MYMFLSHFMALPSTRRVHAHSHTFMWPIQLNLLYLTNLQFLGPICPCSLMAQGTHVVYMVFRLYSIFPGQLLFSLSPPALSPCPHPPLAWLENDDKFSHRIGTWAQCVIIFQIVTCHPRIVGCLHQVAFYEMSGLGRADDFGSVHPNTPSPH